jgi:pyruvate/2-oxoglutarate dehydrogenase complex dihydrolipoamide acyltransferase (E2) component
MFSPDDPNTFTMLTHYQATSLALSKHPIVNSTVPTAIFPAAEDAEAKADDVLHEILQHRRNNIGVAMDTTRGLVVPVIRYAPTWYRRSSINCK